MIPIYPGPADCQLVCGVYGCLQGGFETVETQLTQSVTFALLAPDDAESLYPGYAQRGDLH